MGKPSTKTIRGKNSAQQAVVEETNSVATPEPEVQQEVVETPEAVEPDPVEESKPKSGKTSKPKLETPKQPKPATQPAAPSVVVVAGKEISNFKVTDKHKDLVEKLVALKPDELSVNQKANYLTIVDKMSRIIFTVERCHKDEKYTLLYNRTNTQNFIKFVEENKIVGKITKEPEGYYYDGDDLKEAMTLAGFHLSQVFPTK